MFNGKPIIGLLGGIGAGKSHVAALMGQMGCFVIESDAVARQAYSDEEVRSALRRWWGTGVFTPEGEVDRGKVAARVFSDAVARQQVEGLIHPLVRKIRERQMTDRCDDPTVRAFVWDSPLLVETGMYVQCDALVFVEAPLAIRIDRVQKTRGWDEAELLRREKSQTPLDKKRSLSDYIVVSTADADVLRGQVREVLSRILA